MGQFVLKEVAKELLFSLGLLAVATGVGLVAGGIAAGLGMLGRGLRLGARAASRFGRASKIPNISNDFGIHRNAAIYQIEQQQFLTRKGINLQKGTIKSRQDYLNGIPVRRVDFDHPHGTYGQPHAYDLHTNPNKPWLVNAGPARYLEPGEYLSPVLSDPRIQGGIFIP